jgi:mobilization protein NikA
MHTTASLAAAPTELNRLRGRGRRTQNLSTKLTEEEERRMEEAARAAGKTLSEWAREVLLEAAPSPAKGAADNVLLTEVVGLQLLLMNALAPLTRGEHIGSEQYQVILKSVQASKSRAAQELLARRARGEEM